VLVMSLLEKETSPDRCVKKLEKMLDVETKAFVKALWRFIIFEQLKIKEKLL